MNTLTQRFPLIFMSFAFYWSALPVHADYNDLVKQTLEQAKQDCMKKGWVFEQHGTGSSCSPPEATGKAIGQAVGNGQQKSPTIRERIDSNIYRDGAGVDSAP